MPQTTAVILAKIGAAIATAAGAVGFSSGTAVTIGATSVKIITATAKVALLAGLNKVVAHQNRPRQQGQLITLTINPEEPRRLQIGKRLHAGVLIDWFVKGSKNDRLFMIVYLGEGPMGACTRLFTGGRVIHTTTLAHGTRTVIPGWRSTESGTRGDRLWVTYYDGRVGQTADASLIAQSVGWTSDHIGTGCAYAIVEAQWDSDNMRTPPVLQFETEGATFYDRRKDTTAGGSGSHRADDPATWELSDNPAVALDHYLLGRYLGGIKTFGVGLEPDDVPFARFAALANLCDENVDRKTTGTLKRYRANGFLFSDRSYGDTIRDLCRAMNARPADFGGRIGVIDSEARVAVMTLSDLDVIEGSPEQYSPKRSWGDLVNEVRGIYIDPAQLYQPVEYPRVTEATFAALDGNWFLASGGWNDAGTWIDGAAWSGWASIDGTPKEATLDLEMETDVERAQRLAYLFAVRERRQAQLTGVYGLKAIELEQGDWFIRSGGIFGPGKTFEVIDRSLDVASMTVAISAFEVDPADSAWDENISQDPPPAAISNADTLLDMQVPSITVTTVTLAGATAQVPAIRVQWVAPTDPRVRQIIVEAVPQAGGVPTSAQVDVDTGEVVFTSGITDATAYNVRARFIGLFFPSAWTANVGVTTLSTYTVGAATTVPWSGVTGTGKPQDNADVTATATAFTGEVAARIAADTALLTDINTRATVTQLQTAENTLNTSIAAVQTNLTAETTARTAADSALQTDVNTRATVTQLQTAESTLTTAIAAVQTNLTAETTARTNADTALQTDINTRATVTQLQTAESTLTTAIAAVQTNLTAETTARTNADTALQTDINTRATVTQLQTAESTLTGAIATVSTNLSSETTNRTNADTALQGQITTNAGNITTNTANISTLQSANTTNTSAIATLQTNLSAETTNRTNADTNLQGQITTNAGNISTNTANISTLQSANTTNTSAIATLQTNLAAETTNRTNADTALQTDINTRATVTQLQTAESTLNAAIATSATNLTAAYQAADATLQSDINTRATSAALSTESSARAAGDSANASSITTLSAQVSNPRANLIRNSTGAQGLSGWIVGAGAWGAQQTAPDVGTHISTGSIGSPFILTPDFPVFAGVGYTLGINAGGTGFSGGFLAFVWYNSAGTFLGSSGGVAINADVGYPRIVHTATPPTNAASARLYIYCDNATGFLVLFQAKAEIGGQSTTWRDDAHLANVSAQVSNIAEAYATNDAAKARLVWTVNTSTNAATIEQTAATGFSDGTWNGSAIKLSADLLELLAKDINFGTNTTFEDTYGTLSTTKNNRRLRMLGPFPASDDIVLWFGPTSVALNSETKTNGNFALGTDGKIYLGNAELTVSGTLDFTYTNGFSKTLLGSGTNTTNQVSFTGTGGSGSGYTFAHELILTSTTGPTPTISSSSGSPITVSATGSVGDTVIFFVQTTVTDSAGNKATKSKGGLLIWDI
jgi:hypothetical protein